MNENTMHLFAGAGGGLLADLILGKRPIIAVEWDKYACSVLRARAADGWFPDLSVFEGDVRLFDPSDYAGRVGCIHAGFPCQDISVAGKQAGVGEETRSGLYREVLRIADVVRARELFLENVSAILNNGLGTVLADLSARGYSARWICIRASDVGANHGRDRWWLLARREEGTQEAAGLAYPSSIRQQGQRKYVGQVNTTKDCDRETDRAINDCEVREGWWKSEPDVGRVANGVADRVGKLKALGNGQVPLQAAVAYSILEECFNACTL
jgi:DNA (cytosine-5)-methyltransferase 1